MKKANKKSTKGRGVVWKKGHSSVFNPSCNKHRLAAKKRAAFSNKGSSNLTEDVLARHNRITTESICDDVMSVGGDTAITAFTNCSLPTFNRLFKNWNAGSLLHKEMIAVLAAVTEILKSKGLEENETDYFAALITTLDVVDTDEGITAAISLLAMLVKRLPVPVLKSKSKIACEIFIKLLVKYMNSDHTALLRNLLTVIHAFLKVQTQWSESSDDFNVLLEFTTHHKPKVRKIAQHVVRTLLTEYVPESLDVHPCAKLVANFCIKKLEKSAAKSSRDTFYMLALLQAVLAVFPPASIKTCCETIFKVMTLSNSMVTLSGLKALQGLFAVKSSQSSLPADLNARIISALYDYQPNVKEFDSLILWIQLMEMALLKLFSLDEKLCISHLPKFFAVAAKCWLSENDNVMRVITVALKSILETCVNPQSEIIQQILFEDPVNNSVHKMFHTVEEALSYQYHRAWPHVLATLAVFFEVIGKHCYTAMMKCLHSLGDLHDSYNFQHIYELEKAIGAAIQNIGPRIVLQAIPLQIDGQKPDFPRSWMLPLLRDSIKRTELGYFTKFFLPLALKMRKRAVALKESKLVESKLFELVCTQIWSLLPGFCTEPTDMQTSFKEIARTLGVALKQEPSLRSTILTSLRLLITKNLENEESLEEMRRYSSNYLRILFNLYMTETKEKADEKIRLSVYETCKVYLQISSEELCSTLFNEAMVTLLATEEAQIFKKHALMDLCKAMLSRIGGSEIEKLYDFTKPLLQDTNRTLQKKAYSIIKQICCLDVENCKVFVRSHLKDLRLLLSGAANGLTPGTRALRLYCLLHIVSQLTENEKSTLIEMIPEAILCTKENSVKARTVAYELLVEICKAFQRFMPENSKGALLECLTYIRVGLVENDQTDEKDIKRRAHFRSASALALGCIMYECRDILDSEIIALFVHDMCKLVEDKSGEVVNAALSFFKVLFAAVDTNSIAQHISTIVKSLTTMSEKTLRPFRFKRKEIFTRLVRKFGFEMIYKMVPDAFKKQLSNIKKLETRKQGKKDSHQDDSDSEMFVSKKKSDEFDDLLADTDEDDIMLDDAVQDKPRRPQKKIKKSTMLEENAEEDIVDFLDPSVNKRLLTKNPTQEVQQKKIKQGDSFPIAEDGRLIIEEEEEDSKKSAPVAKRKRDEKMEVLAELGAISQKKKRKFEDSDDEEEEKEKAEPRGVKKGIHRAPSEKKLAPGAEFKAKKAGGDVKKGKVEPFAYLPLNPQALNKRKQLKIKGQYKNIVRSARKGAMVGIKRKSRDAKKKKNR